MEIKYEKYMSLDRKAIIIDSDVYHLAIDVVELNSVRGNIISVVLPYEIFEGYKSPMLKDENGNIYSIGSPAFIKFIDDIPDWYFSCGLYEIRRVTGNRPVGAYFMIMPDNLNG